MFCEDSFEEKYLSADHPKKDKRVFCSHTKSSGLPVGPFMSLTPLLRLCVVQGVAKR